MPGVLEVLGYPKRIKIHRGVRANAGKIVIEAAEDEDAGAITFARNLEFRVFVLVIKVRRAYNIVYSAKSESSKGP